MANTYAINTTRGKEFEVEAELKALGLHPWVARRLGSRVIKERRETVFYDVPYISKLVFCAFPAVYWPDVVAIKHVVGKPMPMTRSGIHGIPAFVIQTANGPKQVPKQNGLIDFRSVVEAEYADAERKRDNNLYQCTYEPGQALEVLSGQFAGMPVTFEKAIKRAHQDYAKLRVDLGFLGVVELDPDRVAPI